MPILEHLLTFLLLILAKTIGFISSDSHFTIRKMHRTKNSLNIQVKADDNKGRTSPEGDRSWRAEFPSCVSLLMWVTTACAITLVLVTWLAPTNSQPLSLHSQTFGIPYHSNDPKSLPQLCHLTLFTHLTCYLHVSKINFPK